MQTKVQIGENSKVVIKWKVLPIDYSREAESIIISKMASKYGISKDNIKVEAQFITKTKNNEDTLDADNVVNNINDPVFQQNLFKDYIEEKNVENCDFEKIVEIDNYINNSIDYDKYDKNKQYTIKWVKWSNFMSYGPDNFVDFTNLKGLVLLSSNPANQGGKSTFCVDLIRFLLFGKVTSRESDWTLSKVFNKHLPEATEVTVEGCIMIDGDDYVIKRVVTRPSLAKRSDKSKVSQKVNYYRLVNDEYLDLSDVDNQEEVSTTQTNKAIKEAIGNERDFDLMISVNSDNLKGLISLKDTERGRLLSRWIGLLPLEEKDKIARETFNKQVTPKLLINRYNKEDLKLDNEGLMEENEILDKDTKLTNKKLEESEKKLHDFRINRDALLQSIQQIDESLTKVDVKTVENKLETLKNEGINKKAVKEANEAKLKEYENVTFDENVYNTFIEDEKNTTVTINSYNYQVNQLKNDISALEKGKFCHVCGARLKGVDNSATIIAKKSELERLQENIATLTKELTGITEKRKVLDVNRTLYTEKVKLELIISKNEVDIDNLRMRYRENLRILQDIEANKSAIENNNRINNSLNIINVNIQTEERIINTLKETITSNNKRKEFNDKKIEENKQIIETIIKEEKILYHWRVYLDMVGKNGVTKMVLRNTLPIINGELSQMLNGVCDFTVEVAIDERQDVAFYLIHDNVRSNLASGSGLEQTIASLALRSVLSRISTFSKPSFVVFDEILGGVADENYDNVKKLYDKIIGDYSTILEITHLKAIHDWHDKSILISKNNNISTISMY
jgi:hypothetical protein